MLEFREVLKHVGDYPPRSMTFPAFRALCYMLICVLRPQLVVEIGTMYAGTSELFASALMANGLGMLTTVDPYGGDRVPATSLCLAGVTCAVLWTTAPLTQWNAIQRSQHQAATP